MTEWRYEPERQCWYFYKDGKQTVWKSFRAADDPPTWSPECAKP